MSACTLLLKRVLLAAGASSCLAGCFGIPISDVPLPGPRSAEVFVVREKVHVGSLISQFLSVDGVTIARLDNGEFTKFSVSEGAHTLRIQWRVPLHGPYVRTVRFEAQAGGKYLFVASAERAPRVLGQREPDYSEGMSILQWDWGDHDRKIEGKTYVPPGRGSSQL